MKYDVCYYWVGGSERGEWRPSDWGPEACETLRRMGYYAVPGLLSIGPPEGPPRDYVAFYKSLKRSYVSTDVRDEDYADDRDLGFDGW